MKSRLAILIVVLLFLIGLELYTYYGLESIIDQNYHSAFFIVYLLHIIFVLFAYLAVYIGMKNLDILRSAHVHFMVGVLLTSLFTKLVFVSFLLLQDTGRAFWGFGTYITSIFNEDLWPYIPARKNVLTEVAVLMAAITFSAFVYGLTFGKYRFRVKDVNLYFDDLPKSFNGFKIIQMSDIHAGSFNNMQSVIKGLELVNDQHPDVILITGDLVNAHIGEIDTFIEAFGKLKARHGKFAVLGNHDYYGCPGPRGSKEYQSYMQDFEQKIRSMGFRLLNNDSVTIQINDESIHIVGVENWGAARYFQKYGDLDKALINNKNGDFNILMSHDPTHWDAIIRDYDKKVQLTLSGHTHGMQFGIDVPWLKWSPVKYTYKYWMGLYYEKDQYLYVNRGFGYLGLPGRVGIWPEITAITLYTT